MPFLPRKDEGVDKGGYGAYKLSAFLPQVQEGAAGKREAISNRTYWRAERRQRRDIEMKIITLVEDTAGSGSCGYEHGLSFYIETEKHKLLVDSGATDLFLRNAELLQVDIRQVDTLILSHGHYDHGGGIPVFARYNPHAKIYMSALAGGDYYNLKNGGEKYIGIDKRCMDLPQCVQIREDLRIDEELYLFSGITGNRYPAKGNLLLKEKVGDTFVQDTFAHEQCLVITQGERHILMSGCAHNGILNILDKYVQLFHSLPDIVISGFHLMQSQPYDGEEVAKIEKIAQELKKTGALFYTGHCTGQAAYDIMKPILGEQLRPIRSGEVLIPT